MSPTPENEDRNSNFDPRSETFLESLRKLIEFKVRRENFDENSVEIHRLFSRSMIDALEFATHELEGEGWHVMSITRIWDDDSSTRLSGDQIVTESEDDFWQIVQGINDSKTDRKFPQSE